MELTVSNLLRLSLMAWRIVHKGLSTELLVVASWRSIAMSPQSSTRGHLRWRDLCHLREQRRHPWNIVSHDDTILGYSKLTNIPWYFPLSRRGTTSLTMSCATVISPPPPIPVKARKIVSCKTDCAKDEASDPTKNITRPNSRMILRDQISDNLPYMSCPTVEVLLLLA